MQSQVSHSWRVWHAVSHEGGITNCFFSTLLWRHWLPLQTTRVFLCELPCCSWDGTAKQRTRTVIYGENLGLTGRVEEGLNLLHDLFDTVFDRLIRVRCCNRWGNVSIQWWLKAIKYLPPKSISLLIHFSASKDRRGWKHHKRPTPESKKATIREGEYSRHPGKVLVSQ